MLKIYLWYLKELVSEIHFLRYKLIDQLQNKQVYIKVIKNEESTK